MEITSYTNFRQNLKAFFDTVFANKEPLFISRPNGEDMVVLAKSEYDSMTETLYLLNNPKNAQRLLEGIEQYNSGKGELKNIENLKKCE